MYRIASMTASPLLDARKLNGEHPRSATPVPRYRRVNPDIGIMRQLVQYRRVIGFRRRARRGADEGIAWGKLNAIYQRADLAYATSRRAIWAISGVAYDRAHLSVDMRLFVQNDIQQ